MLNPLVQPYLNALRRLLIVSRGADRTFLICLFLEDAHESLDLLLRQAQHG